MADKSINRYLNIYINDKQVENSAKGVAGALKHTENSIRKLDASQEGYNEKLKELTDRYKVLQRQHQAFRNQLKETPGILGKIKNALGPVATGMLTAFSIQGLVTGFVNKVREAGRIIVEFDQKQANLAATMGRSKVSIRNLTADAIKYGATTSYSAAEVSDLQLELARLGKTEGEIRGMTKAVLESATALEAGLGTAAELIGGQLNSYSAGAGEAQRFSDIMANSVNMSATSFESLSTALPKVSKVAAINNVTFEKLNGTLGVLADNNIAAETAGTGFRNILLTAAKEGKHYDELLQDVNKATDKTAKATELFGKENATVAVIMATSTDKINANTRALENSAGAAEKLAKEKMNSISGAMKNFSSAWEGFLLNLEKGDGWLGRTIKKTIELGSSILGLITPTKRLSDEIEQEQLNLNMLVGKITSTNISNAERKQLIQDLKKEYPDFCKLIDVETASNKDLWATLNKINEEYVKRIALQRQAEKVEDAQKDAADEMADRLMFQEKLYQELVNLKLKYDKKLGPGKDLATQIDFGNLKGSADELYSELEKLGVLRDKDFNQARHYLEMVRLRTKEEAKYNALVRDETETLIRQKAYLGVKSEEERRAAQELIALRQQAVDLGMKENEAQAANLETLNKYIAAKKKDKIAADEAAKGAGESEAEKKAREKRQKQLEDWAKEDEALQKQLLETQRAATDARLDVLADGFDKELQLINEQYARRTEDLQAQLTKEAEIEALQKSLGAAKKKGDAAEIAHYQSQLDSKLELNKALNDQIVTLEKKRMLEVGTLQEKYLKKEFQRAQEAKQAEINSLKIKQNYELAEFTSLQNAKAVLADYLSAEELRKVTTLEQAKKKIKEEHQKQELAMQERHLNELMAQIESVFAMEKMTGVTLVSPEERREMLAFLDECKLKVSEIRAAGSESAEVTPEADGSVFKSSIDILGTSAEEWERLFANLDTFKGKIEAFATITSTVQQAFGKFFDFLDARDQASLQRFERSNDRKKRSLADQLEKGYITQEIYNARVEKLDFEMEKKRAEIEYKKAKREKVMGALEIGINTSIGIMKAIAAFPLTGGQPWTSIIAGLGALELAAVLATPLPPKGGFKTGGYTGDGPVNAIAGDVHRGEYVVPNDVLFDNDPVVPNIVGYLEAKRKRKRGFKDGGETSDDVMPAVKGRLAEQAQGASGDTRMIEALERNNNLLQYLIDNGIDGYVLIDSKAAKKIQQETKKLERLQNGAKIT